MFVLSEVPNSIISLKKGICCINFIGCFSIFQIALYFKKKDVAQILLGVLEMFMFSKVPNSTISLK